MNRAFEVPRYVQYSDAPASYSPQGYEQPAYPYLTIPRLESNTVTATTMVQEYESHHGSLRHQSAAFFNVGYAPDAVDMGGMAAVPPLMTVDCMDLQLGHNMQSHAPPVAMGNDYQNAVMGLLENSVYPPLNMENNAIASGSTGLHGELPAIPDLQTYPWDSFFPSELHRREFSLAQHVQHYPRNGEIVPQEKYVARSQYFETTERIIFTCNGRPGIRLGPLLRGDLQGLDYANERESFQNFGQKILYRVNWPGYPLFSLPKHIRKVKQGEARYLSRQEIVRQVMEVTQTFIQAYSLYQTRDERWRVGAAFIELQDLVLLGIDKVARGSAQPIYQLAREQI